MEKTTRKRLLNCYVFSVLKCGCESWTVNKNLMKRIAVFEQWCYRSMLKISWKDSIESSLHVTLALYKLFLLTYLGSEMSWEKRTAILWENCAIEIGVCWTCVKRCKDV